MTQSVSQAVICIACCHLFDSFPLSKEEASRSSMPPTTLKPFSFTSDTWIQAGVVHVICLTAIGVLLTFDALWLIALGLDIVYLLACLYSTRRVEKMVSEHDERIAAERTGTQHLADAEGGEHDKVVPCSLSLLYVVTLMSLMLPGCLLSFRLLPCGDIRDGVSWKAFDGQDYYAVPDTSVLPPKVKKWDAPKEPGVHSDVFELFDHHMAPTFVETEEDKTLYIIGSNEATTQFTNNLHALWVVKKGEKPQKLSKYIAARYPTILGSTKDLCFISKDASQYSGDTVAEAGEERYGEDDASCLATQFTGKLPSTLAKWAKAGKGSCHPASVYCGNVDAGFKNKTFPPGEVPGDLFYHDDDGTLWVHTASGQYAGNQLYKIDTKTMETTGYSKLQHSKKKHAAGELFGTIQDLAPECDFVFSSPRAWGSLFTSALPGVVISIWMWKRSIPSSAMTLFLSLGGAVSCFGAIIAPYDQGGAEWFGWWMFAVAPVWMLICGLSLAVYRVNRNRTTLWWSVNGLCCIFVFVHMVDAINEGLTREEFEDYGAGALGFSFATTLLVYVPMLLMGILLDSKFVFSMSAVGMLIDSLVVIISDMDYLSTPLTVSLVMLDVALVNGLYILLFRFREAGRNVLQGILNALAQFLCGVDLEQRSDPSEEEPLQDLNLTEETTTSVPEMS